MNQQYQDVEVKIEGGPDHLMGFKYFWLKSVEGFDDTNHCAKCLLGNFDWRVRSDMAVDQWIKLTKHGAGEILYFCGVAYPWRWQSNFHLAGVVDPEAPEIRMRLYTGQFIRVKGLRKLEFTDAEAKKHYSHLGRKFVTCRNFQFAAEYFPLDEDKRNKPPQPMLFD